MSAGTVRLKIYRYDPEVASDPKVQARLAAIRAWATATDAQVTGESRRESLRESTWRWRISNPATVIRSWPRGVAWSARASTTGDSADLKSALLDAQRAARSFEALGAARNAGRARLLQVSRCWKS